MVAAVRVTQKGFAAVSRPLDGPVQFFRGPSQANIFGIQINFGAKTTANVRRNHTHFVLRQAHDKGGEQEPFDVRVLV